MTARKWGLVFLWFPDEPEGAELIARLTQRADHVEVRGTVGSNMWLFLTTVAVTAFVVIALLIGWAKGELESPVAALFAPVVAAGYYFLKRRNPFGGPLIDSLQHLLEAEPIARREGDPITRF